MQKMKRIVAWIALVAVMLSSFAFAEDTVLVEAHEHAEIIEQVLEPVVTEEPAEETAEEAIEEPTEEETPEAEELPAEEIPAEEELPAEEEAGIALLSMEEHECWNSCLTPGFCGTCGAKLDSDEYELEHDAGTMDVWIVSDLGDGRHAYKCHRCGEYFGAEEHWADCTKGGNCVCGVELDPEEYGDGHYGYDYDYGGWRGYDMGDGTHVYKCDRCGEFFGAEEHWADCSKGGKCGACEAELDPDEYGDGHVSYSDEAGRFIYVDLGNGKHAEVCQRCGTKYNEDDHGVSCWNNDTSKCQDCGISLEGMEIEPWHNFYIESEDRDNCIDLGNGKHAKKCFDCEGLFEEGEHWALCTNDGRCGDCNAELDPEEYGDGHGMLCSNPGVCANCGCELNPEDYNYGHDGHDDEFGGWRGYDMGDGTHAYKCNRCGEFFGIEEHWADCTKGGKCGACEAELDPDEYGDGHWMICTEPGVCQNCGCELNPEDYNYGHDGHDDEFGGWRGYDMDDGTHAYKCNRCGEFFGEDDHDGYDEEFGNWRGYDLGDGTHSFKCGSCGVTFGAETHGVSCDNPDKSKCENCGVSFEGLEEGEDYDVWHYCEDEDPFIDLGDGTHGRPCRNCGDMVDIGDHGVVCTDEDKTKCRYCGTPYNDEGDEYEPWHEYWNEETDNWNWIDLGDGTHGVKCLECGCISEEHEPEEHIDDCKDATGACIVCGAKGTWKAGNHRTDESSCTFQGVNTHLVNCCKCGKVLQEAEGCYAFCWSEDKKTCHACGATPDSIEIYHSYWGEAEETDENGCCIHCGEQLEQIPYCQHEVEFAPMDDMPGYHSLTCVKCGELLDISECYGKCNQEGDEIGTCVECGAKLSADAEIYHSLRGDFERDENCHWYTCWRCGEVDKKLHVVSCDNPSFCMECGYEDCASGKVIHDLVNSDEAGYCGRCGKHAIHYASCKNPNACAECGEDYLDDDIRHRYNVEPHAGEAIPGNPDYCGYRCMDCGLWDSVEKHCVSCDSTDNRCVNCGTIVENPVLNHQVDWDDFGYDENGHWTTCVVCGKEVREAHFNWCYAEDNCALGCENVKLTTIWHATGIDYTAAPTQLPDDETKHGWYCETCGGYAAVAEHSYVDGLCICGAMSSTKLEEITVPASMTLAVGQTGLAEYEVIGSVASMSYKSSKTSVASVDANGNITAKKVGSATITVTATGVQGDSLSAEIKLTVKKAPTKIVLPGKKLNLGVDESVAVKTTLSPSGAYSPLNWESSDETIVSIDESGKLVAVGEGSATVTVATFNGKKASCTVSVLGAPASLTVDKDEVKLIVKKTATIKAEVKSEKGGECAGTLTYESSDPSIATVDAKGKITAKKTGEAIITVSTYNGLSQQVKVGVFKAPSKVSLDVTKATVNRGETLQLNAIIAEDCYASFSWSSSSKKVATVDANGLVTAVAEGSATITVKTNNGKKATAKITVVDPYKPTGVELDRSGNVMLNLGETLQLNATLKPETAQSELKWTSSSKNVATVDENGLVTAVAEGTTTITVQTYNGKKDTMKVQVVDPSKPASIKLDRSGTIEVALSEELVLVPTIMPETAETNIKWSSSNKKIAVVEDGLVTTLKTGTVTITAQTDNGLKATVKVKVTAQNKKASYSSFIGTWKLDRVIYEGISISAGEYSSMAALKVNKSGVSFRFGDEIYEIAKDETLVAEGLLFLAQDLYCAMYGKNVLLVVIYDADTDGYVGMMFKK